MSDPTRQQILEAVRTRLLAIRTNNGFRTDGGREVFLNETPMLGPDDPDVAIAIVTDDDEVNWQGEQVVIALPIGIQALAKADMLSGEPWIAVEQVIGDIKQAVELADRTFGGLFPHPHQFDRGQTRTLEREAGSAVVGASITYRALYKEVWGSP